MLKLIGITFILGATTLSGFLWAARYASRPRHIRQFRTALQRLETEIHYGATPLPAALAQIAKPLRGPVGKCLANVADRLIHDEDPSLIACWKKGLLSHWDETSLQSSEKDILMQFGVTLGVSDREDQVKHIRLAISQLEAEEENAIMEQRKYEKLCRTMGVLLGALIVILMY